jgi:hypothetical protein
MSEKRLNEELVGIEAALSSLTPGPSGVGRDRLMFLAGRASASRRCRSAAAWLWPCAMATSLVVAATFGLLWAAGGKREVVERVAYVPAQSVPAEFDVPLASPSPPSPWANGRLCRLVLEKGMDALPQTRGSSTPNTRPAPQPDTYRSLLNELLNNPTT